ncbi:MAG: ABC transporter permease [Chlorobium sp.]|nr:MAG: ABC transporter permease [Chlorobium sp.]
MLDLKEVWRYRDLLEMFVRRDIVTFYKQTILGPLWYFIQPLFTTVMFMFIFGGLAGISTDGLPQALFYMSGVLCWNYFADCLNRTSETFTANQHIFGKVYFPRLVVPLSITVSNLVKMCIQALLFIAIYLYFVVKGSNASPNLHALLFPVLLFILAGLGLGFGLLISAMTTKYRDLKFLVQFGVQLWMYATPVIYPLSIMKRNYPQYLFLLVLNPMTAVIETFRYGFLGQGTFSWAYLFYSFAFTVVLLLAGTATFNKVEKSVMDVV